MFRNVGKEIKVWAQIAYVIGIIVSVAAGVVRILSAIDADNFDLALGGFLIIVCGCIAARLSVIVLYAFGELVETTSMINQKMSALLNRAVYERNVAQDKTEGNERKTWNCPTCNAENSNQCAFCSDCGTSKSWAETELNK